MHGAILYGDLDNIRWLRGYRKNKNNIWRLSKYILKNRHMICPWNTSTMHDAILRGDLNIIRWLRGYRFIRNLNGSSSWKLDKCLIDMKDMICPYDKYAYYLALSSGNIQVVNWLQNDKCPIKNIYN